MAFLQNTTLLQSIGHGWPAVTTGDGGSIEAESQNNQNINSRSSLAALIQLVRNPVETVGVAVERWYDGLTAEERAREQGIGDRKHILYLRQSTATTYEEWKAAATELDELEGNNEWKTVVESPDYDSRLVEARLQQLDEARTSCDVGRMLFLVRTALTRGLGDMGNIKLYKYTHIGTKDLIERYITSALETLDALLDISARAKCDGLETKHILEQVLSARQAFGRSALLLSGGATFGMNHIGVLKTLWEIRLLPRIISGASAGSIVCAVLCTRNDEEMPELLASFCHGDLAVFEEEGNEDGVLQKVARFLKHGALFDISHLIRVMKDMLGDITFQEAYNRTRRILNICVSSASLYELPRLLNYVTAPNVLIWSAVCASCSVPFIFSPASLLAKDMKTGEIVPWNPSPQRWIDGSVDNDLPMTRLAEMFNVNHFIVSQVNPHVIPFLVKDEDSITQQAQQSTSSIAAGPTWLHSVSRLAKGEALHRMQSMAEVGIFPNTLTKAVSVLSQKYSGDITIFPEISYSDFPRMLSNPTPEFMEQAQLCGERATWPKLSRIRNHCAIELALDDAVQKLRTRVVFSSSQADLRLATYNSSSSTARRRGFKEGRVEKHRRRMSQASDPNVSVVRDSKEGRYITIKGQQHQKSRSINNFHMESDRPSFGLDLSVNTNVPSTVSYTRTSVPSNRQNDIISSGAETSNFTPSDSDADASSSSTESPFSPASPTPEETWSTSRQLFPYASQPVTPANDHRYSAFPTSAATPSITTSTPQRNIESASTYLKSFSMTPSKPVPKASQPGSSEVKYKRLFHSARSKLRSPLSAPAPVTPVSAVPVANTGVKRFNAMGLEIDLSGTRGLVMRKKHPE